MKTYNKKHKVVEVYGALLVDLFCIAVSFIAAYQMRLKLPFGVHINSTEAGSQIFAVCIAGCVIYNLMANRYHHFFQRGMFDEAVEVIKYNIFLFVAASACVYLFRLEGDFSRLMLGYFTVVNTIAAYLCRSIFKGFIRKHYRTSKGSDKVLIMTSSDELPTVQEHICEDKGWSYEIIGYVITDKDMTGQKIDNIPVVANADNVIDVARQMPIDILFLHCPGEKKENLELWVQSFMVMGVRCYNSVQRFSIETPFIGTNNFADFPVLFYAMNEIDYRRRIVKRLMDIVGGMFGLIGTAILTPFIALAIKIDSPGPVFFAQPRIGKNGRRFKIYKFRSMYIDAEERKKELMAQNEMSGLMFKMEKDPRITKVGDFIRKTSIDELPQFWNVVKGDMSLVGTRPPTVDEFERYNIYYRRRLSITPGLTGMWQVSGRSDIKDFDEVVKLDLQYIDNWSLRKDVKIIFQTIGVVLFRKGSR